MTSRAFVLLLAMLAPHASSGQEALAPFPDPALQRRVDGMDDLQRQYYERARKEIRPRFCSDGARIRESLNDLEALDEWQALYQVGVVDCGRHPEWDCVPGRPQWLGRSIGPSVGSEPPKLIESR